ncbi:MAG: fibronectin type III domain-containing protein [Eubacterium sp.]|nr:fibronectin type III domain-containing protein [Eubacterium sp.]
MKKLLSFVITLIIAVQSAALIAYADYSYDLSECAISLWEYYYTYDGSANKPSVDIINPDGDYLIEDVDFYVKYSNNINAGTGKVTAYGMGDYTGSISDTFIISKSEIKSSQVYLWNDEYTYSGKAKKPLVSVYFPYTDSEMTEGKHYKLTYSNNVNPGTAKVTVKGIGNYKGTVTKSFKIKLAKTVNLKTTALSKSSVKLQWKKQNNVTGYQVQKYNSNKHSWSTVKKLSKNTNSLKISKAYVGTQYKFRVRSYKKIGSKTYYGAYSKAKKYYVAMPKKVKKLHSVYSTNLYGMVYETKMTWNKQSGVSGYQVKFLSGENATNYSAHYYKLKGAGNNSDTFTVNIMRIPDNKPFYYVRAYTVINGRTYYGPWKSW